MPASLGPPAARLPAPTSRQILGVSRPSPRGPGMAAEALGLARTAALMPCMIFRREKFMADLLLQCLWLTRLHDLVITIHRQPGNHLDAAAGPLDLRVDLLRGIRAQPKDQSLIMSRQITAPAGEPAHHLTVAQRHNDF